MRALTVNSLISFACTCIGDDLYAPVLAKYKGIFFRFSFTTMNLNITSNSNISETSLWKETVLK